MIHATNNIFVGWNEKNMHFAYYWHKHYIYIIFSNRNLFFSSFYIKLGNNTAKIDEFKEHKVKSWLYTKYK